MPGVAVIRGTITVVLTSVSPNPISFLDFNSTLRVTLAFGAMLNGTVITCTDTFNPINTTLTLAGINIIHQLLPTLSLNSEFDTEFELNFSAIIFSICKVKSRIQCIKLTIQLTVIT